ncbi:MAG: hypothetical protein DRP06_03670 [Candidatus Aenigmatarchaeota archaeon]|nr:MAG: hypothetical protein DRP06_03670 [Candidatus Aenigmarchaeota archaeon]
MLKENNELQKTSSKKFPRFLVYLISIGVFFVSSLLLFFILPQVILISDLLGYAAIIVFSVIHGLLFKFFWIKVIAGLLIGLYFQ